MSVHYKFKSALEYDTVTFDGLHISVKDLKNAIIQQKRIGKNTDFDLQVTNAQTKEVYEDEEALIPKNTSLLIARIPVIPSNKSKTWEGYGNDNAPVARADEGGPIAKAVDLSSLDASEDDKIRAMMSQSTQDYDPSNYLKIRGANQVGTVPPNYRCYKCHQTGHWIKDCPLSQGSEPMEIKKSTGIPRSFMVPVEGPQVPGAMMTPNGSYAVPVLDHQTYSQKQAPAPPPVEDQSEIPEDLICSICSGLLTDAVMIPCCGNSFCDECIRSCLLESEDHECPDCHERDISPGTLIPNRYLRNSVANFKNTTGYVKKPTYKRQPSPKVTPQTQIEKKEEAVKKSPKSSESADSNKPEPIEKTVISEADSTEPPKNINLEVVKDLDINDVSKESPSKSSVSEGPPGVSPRREKSPKRPTVRRTSHASSNQNNGRTRHNSKDISPRQHTTRRTPPYEPMPRIEERPGTPTVDEPGNSNNVGNNVYPPTSAPYPSGPPPGILPPMIGMPPPHMQGPPPNYPPGQPPPGVFTNQGPPPNFRLPPPGANPTAPFVPGPYNPPPRPIFDPTRPPMQGPPPNYSSYPPRSRNRDYRDSARIRTRTPPGIIDDPLEAFNRMLREKDERDRRAKQKKGRSYSRSSSRSYSRSPKRPRSRSPRRRNSRSRSRSFSMSRSRSRSFSPSPRNSPYRDYSPRNSSPRRRPPSRFRSPARSPPPRYRYKEGPPINDRNRDRDFDRPSRADRDRGYSRDRDYNYYERDRNRWGGAPSRPPMQDNYYPPPPEVHQLQPPPSSTRYPPRDNYQPYANKSEPPPAPSQAHHLPPILPPPAMHPPPPQRRFEDIAPPGTDQPPIPGEELPQQRYDERYGNYQENKFDRDIKVKDEDNRRIHDKLGRDEDKGRRFERYPSRSPTRGGGASAYKASPRKSRERHESPDKHKRRKQHSEERHERKRETSDEDKSKRSKEKKKKREKKEMEKKKRKEKKEKKEQDRASKKEEKSRKDDGVPEKKIDEASVGVVIKEDKKEVKEIINKEKSPKAIPEVVKMEQPVKAEPTDLLYDDLLSDGVDKSIVKNYGKLDANTPKQEDKTELTPELKKDFESPQHHKEYKDEQDYPPESETSKDEDVLDLHANESELKTELDKSEVLAPLPEKSKWEIDEDLSTISNETLKEGKQERNGKVTTEVLKRAENAIFAKAINAIRPIEIKKISMDRAKLYSGEKEQRKSEEDIRNIQVTISSAFEEETSPIIENVKVESEIQKPPPRLSVKERLGVKVDDLERIVKVSYDRNRSRSLSPLSKRAREERLHLDRRMEPNDRRGERVRHERDRYNRNYRNLDRSEFRRREEYLRRERERRDRERSRGKKEETKRKRTRSRSESKEHKHRKKDKKQKRDKGKKHKRDDKDEMKTKLEEKSEKREASLKPKSATDRRKPTLDEANFEPDYDLESESEKEDGKSSLKGPTAEDEQQKRVKPEEKEQKESSSSDSSDSSSEDDRKRKKHRKHKKKKSRKETSSSSSSSNSDSSEEERERKRKKHKKKQKKRKKSKHK